MASTAYSNHQPSLSDANFEKLDSSRGLTMNRFFESRMNQFNQQPPYPESKIKKALRKTAYVASFGIYYLIRQNKKKNKRSSVCSLDSLTATSSSMPTESVYEDSYAADINDEISHLKKHHQAEIEERDRMIQEKINEVWTLIQTHQAKNKKISDELEGCVEEIARCHKQISELHNEIRHLKKANVDSDTGPRSEKVHQTSQTDHTIPDRPCAETIHQTSQTDHVIPNATIYVSKEWHEKEMRDYVQLVNDEHQSFVKAVQQQILIAEHSKEMAETNNISQLRSENLMLKVDLSVINDIHEAEMAERTRVISDLFNENKTLRADLEAAVDASTKKPRHVNLSYKQPATKTSFMTKIRNYME